MSAPHLLAILAGALSVLLNFSVLTGTIAGIVLTYLTPLPLFMAGLAFGLHGALTAAATGTVLVGIAGFVLSGSLLFVLHYVAMFALPVGLLVRQALLSRPGPGGSPEWYPPGLLLSWLTGLAVVYAVLALAITVAAGDPLEALRSFVEEFLSAMGLHAEPEAIDLLAGSVPSIVAVSWVITTIINGCLAQGLLVRFGRNLRPSAGLADLALPAPLFFLLAIALLASFLPATAGLAGKTLAAIAAVPYFLLGLGVIHRWVRQWTWRVMFLIALYGLIFLLFLPAVLVIVGIGLFEHAGRLRRQRGSGRKEE